MNHEAVTKGLDRNVKMKPSGVGWIGNIPRHWKIVRGKFILSHKKEINSDFQCSNLLSLTLNGVLRKDMNSSEGLIPSDYRTYQVFYPDNLVFKLIDLENIQTSRVGIVPEKGIMSPVYIRLKCNSDLHERYYFYQYYDLYKKHIFNFLGKGVRSSLSPSNLLEIPLAFPLPFEQAQIANFLDRKTEQIDALIRIKERQIELLQEQRTALINQAVTKGLDPNVEMKPSGVEWIGKIPTHWEVINTKYLFQLVTEPAPKNNDYELLSIYTNIGVKPRKELEERGNRATTTDGYWLVKKGDFIVNKLLAWMGAIGLSNYEGVTSPAYDILRKTRSLNERFYEYLFRCGLYFTEFKKRSRGIMEVRLRLYFDQFGQIPLVFPPVDEQDKIVNLLDCKTEQIDELISTEQRKIELLKEYRQSLISEAVTGKIDVRNEV